MSRDPSPACQVRDYAAGCTATCLGLVGPCMGTLGLHVHTHRRVLAAVWPPLLATCAVAGPLCMALTSWAGGQLGVPPGVAASLLPATTTTGLAVTFISPHINIT